MIETGTGFDIDYFEGIMNCDAGGSVNYAFDSYNFNVGDIVVDVDKNTDFNETYENNNTNIAEDFLTVDNSRVINERYEMNTVDSPRIFPEETRVNAADCSRPNNSYDSGGGKPASPEITVNFNAYNEIHSPGTDVDSVMSAFGEKLAEAVSLAAERIHI